ncbi:CDP-alcohol phosphatidyltransferase-like enzyme [Sediminihabitans luteus]|uniref:CDP-alcohol phosphatidyltransferase-like enzyme n=1 Tax=Sediminihabitans luteus TaxID=1138585 RepID=A0A2M9CDA2_9CELL|nr:CDP-alcohol phosphatidyltransferase family protein [Sediminihabitans luteus]PJJ69873.1 CDP-alcohol phosphatidyltransferase-like enzyme [Sediminihabitans luteus]GII99192.1 CDP-alcohol phosphatidyltransferase [Sediminihabitans luteus]
MSAFTTAMTELRDAQKSSSGAPAYSRFVNRPLGRPLAAGAAVLGMTPTQVTLVSALFTFAGILTIAVHEPTLVSSLVVTLLLVLGYALDSADGQLARLTGTGSLAGEWLDHFFDALKAAAIHAAVLVSWFRFTDLDDAWLLVPIVFGIVASGFFFGVVGADLLRRLAGPATDTGPSRRGRESALYSLAVVPADYGFLCISFVLASFTPIFVLLYTLLAAVNLLLLAVSARRWYRALVRARGGPR